MRSASTDITEQGLGIGATVAVFALGASGPYMEGTGTVVSSDAGPNRYHIRFAGEATTKLRFVNPDWQVDPERSLALLREFWRFSHRDDPLVEDFFPDADS